MRTFANIATLMLTLLEIPFMIIGFAAASVVVGLRMGWFGYKALLERAG